MDVSGCTALTHLYCHNNKIRSVIPDWFSQLSTFNHDIRFRYWKESVPDGDGGYVTIRFDYDVPADATLNINSEGAKAIYYRGSAITAGKIKAGDRATFIYDGSYYQLIANDRWGTVSGSIVYRSINQSRSVQADGNKTMSALLNELYNIYVTAVTGISSNQWMQITSIEVPNLGSLTFGHSIMNSKSSYVTSLKFTGANIWAGNSQTLLLGCVYLENNNSHFYYNQKNSDTDTLTNYDSSKPSSGTNIVLRFNILEQI